MTGLQLIRVLRESGTGASKIKGIEAELNSIDDPTVEQVIAACHKRGYEGTTSKAVAFARERGYKVGNPSEANLRSLEDKDSEIARLRKENEDLRREFGVSSGGIRTSNVPMGAGSVPLNSATAAGDPSVILKQENADIRADNAELRKTLAEAIEELKQAKLAMQGHVTVPVNNPTAAGPAEKLPDATPSNIQGSSSVTTTNPPGPKTGPKK